MKLISKKQQAYQTNNKDYILGFQECPQFISKTIILILLVLHIFERNL